MSFETPNLTNYLRRLIVRIEDGLTLNRYEISEGLTSIQITLTIWEPKPKA